MEKNILGCPMSITSRTLVMPATAPAETRADPQWNPQSVNA